MPNQSRRQQSQPSRRLRRLRPSKNPSRTRVINTSKRHRRRPQVRLRRRSWKPLRRRLRRRPLPRPLKIRLQSRILLRPLLKNLHPLRLAEPAVTQTNAQGPVISQPVAAGSGQAVYASPPPMAPPPPRRKFLGIFFIEERTEPLASPQFPPATFPTTYYRAAAKPGLLLAQEQVPAAPAAGAISTAKKPCVLTAWLQKLKGYEHGPGCSGCHHGGQGAMLPGLYVLLRQAQFCRGIATGEAGRASGQAGISARGLGSTIGADRFKWDRLWRRRGGREALRARLVRALRRNAAALVRGALPPRRSDR